MATLNYADTNLTMTGYTDDYQLLMTASFLKQTLFCIVFDAIMKKWPHHFNGLKIHHDTEGHLFIIS